MKFYFVRSKDAHWKHKEERTKELFKNKKKFSLLEVYARHVDMMYDHLETFFICILFS